MLDNSKYTKAKLVFSRWLVFFVAVGVQFDIFRLGSGVSLVSMVLLLYIINCISFIHNSNGFVQKYRKFIYPIALFIILLTMINMFNVNEYTSSFIPKSILIGILLFVFSLAHISEDPKAISFIMAGLLFGGLLMSLFFMLGVGIEIDPDDENRLTMFGHNSNNLGCLMCISVAILLSEVIIRDVFNLKIFRFIFIPLLMMPVSFIFATASRTAFVCLVLIVITVLLLSPFVGRKRTKLLLFVILLVGLYYGYQLFLESDLLYNRIMLSIEEEDTSGRQSIWKTVWRFVLDHPFGVGETGYTLFAKTHFNSTSIAGAASPHNVFLEVLAYTGFIGLLFYVVFWSRLVSTSIKKVKYEKYILPLLFMEIFTVQMFFGQLLNFRIAWLSFAFVAVISIGSSTQQNEDLEYNIDTNSNTN